MRSMAGSPTYGSIDEMWTTTLRFLIERGMHTGSRDGEALETLGWSGTLRDPSRTFLMNSVRDLDPSYAGAELLWYLSGSARVEMLTAYAPSYVRYVDNGTAWGAYGARLLGSTGFQHQVEVTESAGERWTGSQLAAVVEVLKRHPDSRQAVVAMWGDSDLPHAVLLDKKDLPCTLTMQFILRSGALHCVVNMRSNDAWMGMPYDVFCFTAIQQVVAAALGARVGLYHHTVGSMHLYSRHQDKALAAINVLGVEWPTNNWRWRSDLDHREHMRDCAHMEVAVRLGQSFPDNLPALFEEGSVLSDACACACEKHLPGGFVNKVRGEGLRLAVSRRARANAST